MEPGANKNCIKAENKITNLRCVSVTSNGTQKFSNFLVSNPHQPKGCAHRRIGEVFELIAHKLMEQTLSALLKFSDSSAAKWIKLCQFPETTVLIILW